ncbi:MobP2 family relaxase [Enterococcus sp. LJL90]
MPTSPGIISKAKFISPKSKKYSKAIDYIDRKEAVRGRTVEGWHIYSDDDSLHLKNGEGRISTLFDGRQDHVDLAGKQRIKASFIEARANESPMWQTVFSFDNEYLKELGMLTDNGAYTLDESAVREATRAAMSKMIDQMNFGHGCEWAAAIHFNTGNIHVHTMMVVRNPEGILEKMDFYGNEVYRGKVPPKTVRAMKSSFANTIENREPALVRISYLMREELTKNMFSQGYSKDFMLMRNLSRLMNQLPKDRNLWKYNHPQMEDYRPTIDSITKQIIEQNNPAAFDELSRLLDEQTNFYERVYGDTYEGNQQKYYKDNKLQELNSMMGNALLRELTSLLNKEEWKESRGFTPEQMEQLYGKQHPERLTKKALSKLKFGIQESHQDFLNRLSFERDEFKKEMKRK